MRTKLIAVLLLSTLAGCADPAAAPQTADVELSVLEQRTLDLKARVIEAGGFNRELRLELNDLTADIREWQQQTGRSDIAVAEHPVNRDRIYAAVPTGTDSRTCTPCPPVEASGGKICFLVEGNDCTTAGPLILQVCAYVCITLDPNPSPIKRR